MHEITRDLLVSITVVGALFGVIYVFLITRHRERMSILDKGADPSMFVRKSKALTLKTGMLFVGVSLGILTGYALEYNGWIDRPAVAFFAMIFLFGGVSLIVNFIIDQKYR